MSDDGPPTLGYAGRTRRQPTPGEFVAGTVLLAIAFFVAANFVELQTTQFFVQNEGSFGPASLPADEQYDRLVHSDVYAIPEFFGTLPASVAFLFAAAAVPPRRGWRLGWQPATVVLVGAALYSWVRWGLLLGHVRVGAAGKCLVAITLAAAAGLGTGVARRPADGVTIAPA